MYRDRLLQMLLQLLSKPSITLGATSAFIVISFILFYAKDGPWWADVFLNLAFLSLASGLIVQMQGSMRRQRWLSVESAITKRTTRSVARLLIACTIVESIRVEAESRLEGRLPAANSFYQDPQILLVFCQDIVLSIVAELSRVARRQMLEPFKDGPGMNAVGPTGHEWRSLAPAANLSLIL
jgi:hypothetical protein